MFHENDHPCMDDLLSVVNLYQLFNEMSAIRENSDPWNLSTIQYIMLFVWLLTSYRYVIYTWWLYHDLTCFKTNDDGGRKEDYTFSVEAWARNQFKLRHWQYTKDIGILLSYGE